LNIIATPSLNFDDRTLPISLLVLHYTGMETGEVAVERMRDADAKVSAHYMVETDGRIFQLVEEEKRAWHAGVSEWMGETNINSASIGIEIVNGGHDWPLADGSLPPYPDVQINALIPLCKAIMARHDIGADGVVGHSDIAPARKQDPGEHFPWAGLASAGIGRWPQDIEPDRRVLFDADSRDRGVAIVQRSLAEIGYDARVTGVLDADTRLVLAAFQRRYRPQQIDGLVDMETMAMVRWLVER
jgi:N-acetylmuramoyl-L-alanine amidase